MNPTPAPDSGASPVAWLDWTNDAFARARADGRPILLSISANWCHGCAVMDGTTYADPRVTDLIARAFVPIRIDADRRPDINERYNLDGWPTTAVLTPAGEVLTGSTFLPTDAMLSMLGEAAEAYTSRRDALDSRAAARAAARRARPRSRTPGIEPDLAASAWIARKVVDECDPLHGGFGGGGKFLHAPALMVALAEYERAGDAALARALTLTLDGMAGGQVRDGIDGGFFRYASGADWSRPHTEKLLDDQVAMSVVYLEAARAFGNEAWKEVGLDTIRFVRTVLSDERESVFFSSQAADESYYQVPTHSLRRTLAPPRVDRTAFVDATSRAASAWMRDSVLAADPALAQTGARALDRIATRTYQPGRGVAHWIDETGSVRGLLTDQVFASAALLDLHEATANPTWSMLAEELMRTALGELWDEAAGAFFDRVPEPDAIGLLADPLIPPVSNAMGARVLARLSRLTGDPDLQDRALDVLRALTPGYRQQGLFGAQYALAVMDVFR